MYGPKLACCSNIAGVDRLPEFVQEHGFDGVEWTFAPQDLEPEAQNRRVQAQKLAAGLGLEVRFHAALDNVDIGHADPEEARKSLTLFQQVCDLTAEAGGKFLTVHIGLGRDSTLDLSWDRTIDALADLNAHAARQGLTLCLENLAWGWTSRPNLYEKLIRKTGVSATLDLGHARVSDAVSSFHYDLSDFVRPHPHLVRGAHIYHEETHEGHLPPESLDDLSARLDLLRRLPRCDWWVLELREIEPLLTTLNTVREYLRLKNGLRAQG